MCYLSVHDCKGITYVTSLRSNAYFVPEGNPFTADTIHFQIRPRLTQLGIQCWGLTKNHLPRTYAFNIQVEGQPDEIIAILEMARAILFSDYGLKVLHANYAT